MRTSAALVSMLQESHAALVASNEHHRSEIDELKRSHALEVAAFEANFAELAAELAQLRNVSAQRFDGGELAPNVSALPPRGADDRVGAVVRVPDSVVAAEDGKGSRHAGRSAPAATRGKEERAPAATRGKEERPKDERPARANPSRAAKEEHPKEERSASKRSAGCAPRGLHPITTCSSASRLRDSSAAGKEN